MSEQDDRYAARLATHAVRRAEEERLARRRVSEAAAAAAAYAATTAGIAAAAVDKAMGTVATPLPSGSSSSASGDDLSDIQRLVSTLTL